MSGLKKETGAQLRELACDKGEALRALQGAKQAAEQRQHQLQVCCTAVQSCDVAFAVLHQLQVCCSDAQADDVAFAVLHQPKLVCLRYVSCHACFNCELASAG